MKQFEIGLGPKETTHGTIQLSEMDVGRLQRKDGEVLLRRCSIEVLPSFLPRSLAKSPLLAAYGEGKSE